MRPLLAGLSRADSVTLDPHKGLFLPYGTGALLVRDGEALRALHSSTAGYLPENQHEFYGPAQYGPDLSRGFPGLKVWMALEVFGRARFRAALAEQRELAVWAAGEVARIAGVVMDATPQLSLFAFHLESPALRSLAAENAATRALMERVTARGEVMVTGAMVGERYLGRVCVLSFRTRRAGVETCVRQLAEVAAALLAWHHRVRLSASPPGRGRLGTRRAFRQSRPDDHPGTRSPLLRQLRRPQHPTLTTPRSRALSPCRAARRWLSLAAMLAGCGPVGSIEPLGTSHAALTVEGVTGCSTEAVDGLAQQLIAEQNCIRPDALVSFAGTPNVSLASGVYPYLEPAAAAGLVAAAQQTTLYINSAFRTLPEQYLLFRWDSNDQCGIELAASPGNSNHETGTAVDVDNYGAAYSAMTSNGWTQSYPSNDAVHYDYTAGGTIDLRSDSVLAFQRLWNLNYPGDPITEDGSYGPATAARLGASPAEGFAAGPTCATPTEPAWPPLVHRSPVDLDGDGMADVCARAASGVVCSLSSGGAFGEELAGPAWTDANGWGKPQYGSTIQYGDIDGDGRADVCARAVTGMICHPSKVTGARGGGFGAQLDGPAWSDANGWGDPRYYSTIQLADVNGDGKADLCGRSSAGIGCALAVDGGFSAEIAGPAWSDANAWGRVAYYGTIQFADVNGDGKADVCARAVDGIVCNLSDGHGFPTEIHGPAWSDANGWAAVAHGSSIRFPDVNGDGKADVCARQSDGILCNLSDGTGFPTVVYGPAWSDASGWTKPEYFTTIQYADVNGDGKADVCGRAASGVVCALSDGAGFPTEVQGPAWGDGAGWNQPQYFATIGAGDVNGDGKDDLCARDSQGLTCAPATGAEFGPTFGGPPWSDVSGWAGAAYYSTVRLLGGPRRLAPDTDAGADAGADGHDGAGSHDGAADDATPDAAPSRGGNDAGSTSDGGGCACAVVGVPARAPASFWLAAVGALALLGVRRHG